MVAGARSDFSDASPAAAAAPSACRRFSAVDAFSRDPPPTLVSERESSLAGFARDRAGGISDSEGGGGERSGNLEYCRAGRGVGKLRCREG